jgi:hypothetical protein
MKQEQIMSLENKVKNEYGNKWVLVYPPFFHNIPFI